MEVGEGVGMARWGSKVDGMGRPDGGREGGNGGDTVNL